MDFQGLANQDGQLTPTRRRAPFRLDNLHIEVEVVENLNPMQGQGVEEAVHRCLVHNTLPHPPQIDVEIETAVLA
jgi:putative redox protein